MRGRWLRLPVLGEEGGGAGAEDPGWRLLVVRQDGGNRAVGWGSSGFGLRPSFGLRTWLQDSTASGPG